MTACSHSEDGVGCRQGMKPHILKTFSTCPSIPPFSPPHLLSDGMFLALFDGSFHEGLVTQLRKVIQEEISSALRDQQEAINTSVLGVLRSAAVTPSPVVTTPDPQVTQASILALLRQGQLNTAFQQVMSINSSYNFYLVYLIF